MLKEYATIMNEARVNSGYDTTLHSTANKQHGKP